MAKPLYDPIMPGTSPVTPGIREVNIVSLRAEIDTSSPFGSVQEAVTHFGGHGSWVPFSKFYVNKEGKEFDIKKVEEQVAELEKDLIVKELEMLDVLEELGTTKRAVEELKEELKQIRVKPEVIDATKYKDHFQLMLEKEQNKNSLEIAELRWVAAKKMKEAARAAEKLAIAELNALSKNTDLYRPLNYCDPKTTVSMRDVLSRKQVIAGECIMKRQIESHTVDMSELLDELRSDLKSYNIAEKKSADQKSHRRKFGFIHISLPLWKLSKKKSVALNMI